MAQPNQDREHEENAKFPDYNPGPVLRLDKNGIILRANKAAFQILKNDHMVGQSIDDVCPDFEKENWRKIFHSKENLKIELHVDKCKYLFTLVYAEEFEQVFAFGTDVTELREAEFKLLENATELEQYAKFPEMNPGPVLRMNTDGTIILANTAAKATMGEDILGQNWLDIFSAISDKEWVHMISKKDSVVIEASFGEKDYMFFHRIDNISNQVFVYGSDISQLKKAESALVQSEKMATLGTLAAGITHELNNPAAATKRASEHLHTQFQKLVSVTGNMNEYKFDSAQNDLLSEMDMLARNNSQKNSDLNPLTRSDMESEMEDLLESKGIQEPWELAPDLVSLGIRPERVDIIYTSFATNEAALVIQWTANLYAVYSLLYEIGQGAGRISEIVKAMKNYSYLGQAPVQQIDVHEGIENTLVILRNKYKQGITVERDYDTTLPHIMAYGSELNQVWTNILDNAADAMNLSGVVRIHTSAEDNFVKVEISDNGPGIPSEILKRIFDPFFTTKEPGKGTGLGLSTTYNIITEKHKGNISVTSEPGNTRFTVLLPLNKKI